jgi:hypothetical protein
MVGARVQHWWDGNGSWFLGRIIRYNKHDGKHLLKYDDEEEEWMVVADEPIMYCNQVTGGTACLRF